MVKIKFANKQGNRPSNTIHLCMNKSKEQIRYETRYICMTFLWSTMIREHTRHYFEESIESTTKYLASVQRLYSSKSWRVLKWWFKRVGVSCCRTGLFLWMRSYRRGGVERGVCYRKEGGKGVCVGWGGNNTPRSGVPVGSKTAILRAAPPCFGLFFLASSLFKSDFFPYYITDWQSMQINFYLT